MNELVMYTVWMECVNSEHGWTYWIQWCIPHEGDVRNAEDAVDKALTYCAGRGDRIRSAECYTQKPHTYEIKTEPLPTVQFEFKRGVRR